MFAHVPLHRHGGHFGPAGAGTLHNRIVAQGNRCYSLNHQRQVLKVWLFGSTQILTDRFYYPAAGLLLLVMCAVMIGSAIGDSTTMDEPIHLLAGYRYVTAGDPHMEATHPPLARAVAALPLLPLGLLPLKRDARSHLREFVWFNTVPFETMLLRARLGIIGLTLLLGIRLAWWTKQRFGAAVSLLALTFFAFDPNLIAHGHLVTTDLAATLAIFLTATLFNDFLITPTRTGLVLASLSAGLAPACKYSCFYLLGTLPLLYGIVWLQKRGQPFFTVKGAAQVLAALLAGSVFVLGLVYSSELYGHLRFLRSGTSSALHMTQTLAETVSTTSGLGKLFAGLGRATNLPAYTLPVGLAELADTNVIGFPSFLFGSYSAFGWWYYFPLAFLVKTPTATLLAVLLALASLVWLRPEFRSLAWRRIDYLAIPALIYFLLAMASSFNAGIRHILPVYPSLYVILAFVIVQYTSVWLGRSWPFVAAGLVMLLAAESLSVYPHYISSFNWISGGPSHGHAYLLESNIDWGQDVGRLAAYAKDHPELPLCADVFAPYPLDDYGVYAQRLPQVSNLDSLPCVAAVSVNHRDGLGREQSRYAKLRERKPTARIGYSIYLYDLRHDLRHDLRQ